MTEKTEVLIVCPSLNRQCMIDIAATIFHLKDWEHTRPDCEFSFRFATPVGALRHEYARNRAVALLRQFPNAQKMLWLDADVGPGPEETLALLRVDADIATIAYPGFGDNGLLYQIYDTYNPETGMFTTWVPKADDPQVMDIAGCGFGYVVTSRAVLEDPRMQLPRTWTDQEGRVQTDPDEAEPAVFKMECHSHGRIGNGEDLNFCFRAGKLGYRIKALLKDDQGRELLAHHWHQQDYRSLRNYIFRVVNDAFREGIEHGRRLALPVNAPPLTDEEIAAIDQEDDDGDVTAYASPPVRP